MRADWIKHWKGFENVIVNRPWGFFRLWTDNVVCTVKELNIHKNELLSLQFHKERDQVYILYETNNAPATESEKYAFTVWYSDQPFPEELLGQEKFINDWLDKHLKREQVDAVGAIFTFERGYVHRIRYNGPEMFGVVLDLAFGRNNEDDIVRLKDKYDRGKQEANIMVEAKANKYFRGGIVCE
jgi:hypothetical protein